MKYMITWNERSQGSPMEYENAQKRILEVFTQWKAPDNFKIEMFVIRVGDWGGYMLLDCDDPSLVTGIGIESVWKVRDGRFFVGGCRPWRGGSWPEIRGCAARSRARGAASASSSRRFAQSSESSRVSCLRYVSVVAK